LSNAKIRKAIHGSFSEVRFTFPSSYLLVGENQISFTIRVTGSVTTGEVMYDYVRLEADGFKPWPIALVDFTVTEKMNSAFINWNTSSEQNNSHFILSHSTDGLNFKFLSKTLAALNGNSNNSYSYSHLNPVIGDNYYRLQQVDINGIVKDLGIRKLNFGADSSFASKVRIYPNPIHNEVKIEFKKGYFTSAKLIDLQGRVLFKLELSLNETDLVFDVSSLSAGNYLIELDGKEKHIRKLIKV
jgi:hypothetical protein